MAAFHPRTFRLLHELRGSETAQFEFDSKALDRLPKGTQSKKADALRERVDAFPAVAADLTRLLEFAKGVNALYADHDAGLHDDGVQRLTCPICIARDSTPRNAEGGVL